MDFVLFILAIVLAVGLVVVLSFRKKANPALKSNLKWVAVGISAATALCFILSVTTIVAPRTIGVVVEFGKPVKTLSNGLHWKSPWSNVEKLDGAVQNDVYNAEKGNPIGVRLKNNSQAYADASIQWQLKAEDAMEIFLDYRTFENIQENLVDRNFRAALNSVMADYDPLNFVDPASGGEDLEAIAGEVLQKMQNLVGNQIEVKAVTIPYIDYSAETQSRIDELQTEIAKTRIAEQKKATSTAEAEANEILERTLTVDVLTSKCLDIIATSGQSPIGCFPGGGAVPITQVK